MRACPLWTMLFAIWVPAHSLSAPSQCYGSVSKGRIEQAVRLPAGGENFAAYSALGVLAGRTFVHSTVAKVITDSYARVAKSHPELRFVYAETGWANGGRIRPHRTHRNGLSVDFMVPVRNGEGESVALPASIANRFGYDIDFGRDGRFDDYRIDFVALAEHLYQLHRAARRAEIDIALVIFDPRLQPKLFATGRGPYLRERLRFSSRQAWVRHDEHYHVNFAVPCKPLD